MGIQRLGEMEFHTNLVPGESHGHNSRHDVGDGKGRT